MSYTISVWGCYEHENCTRYSRDVEYTRIEPGKRHSGFVAPHRVTYVGRYSIHVTTLHEYGWPREQALRPVLPRPLRATV